MASLRLTDGELAKIIYNGIINTLILGGGYDAVRCSQKNGYPMIGIGKWIGNNADDIFNEVDGGAKFIDTPYKHFDNHEEAMGELKALLRSGKSIEVQNKLLARDCTYYVSRLTHHNRLTNPLCIIYCGMWSVIGVEDIVRFIKSIPDRVDKDNLNNLAEFFESDFSLDSHIELGLGSDEVTEISEAVYNYVFEYFHTL